MSIRLLLSIIISIMLKKAIARLQRYDSFQFWLTRFSFQNFGWQLVVNNFKQNIAIKVTNFIITHRSFIVSKGFDGDCPCIWHKAGPFSQYFATKYTPATCKQTVRWPRQARSSSAYFTVILGHPGGGGDFLGDFIKNRILLTVGGGGGRIIGDSSLACQQMIA